MNILRQIKYALSSRPTWVRNHPYLEGPMKWLIESNWWDAVRSSLLYSSPLLSTVKWRKLDSRLIEMWKDISGLIEGNKKEGKWGSERVKGKRKKKRRGQRGWEGKRTKKEPIILREIPLECLSIFSQMAQKWFCQLVQVDSRPNGIISTKMLSRWMTTSPFSYSYKDPFIDHFVN